MKRALAILLSAILLSGLTACALWRDDSRNPDRVLFLRASNAIDNERFDVARLSLETLINTYPDSELKPRAEELLRDPRLVGVWGSSIKPSTDVTTFMPN